MFGSKLWEGVASGVARGWVDRLLSPALAFWTVGLLAFATARDWTPIILRLAALDTAGQIALAVATLVVVAGTSALVEGFQYWTLRLLEGYWPRLLAPLRRRLIRRVESRVTILQKSWNELAARYARLTPEELEWYGRLDVLLAMYPVRNRLLPTRLGNRLRAAEDYAGRHYGLATTIIWPRLWLLMPESAQKEVSEARERLNVAVRWILWSLLLLVWSTWAWWWVIPAALLGALWGYWQALDAAGIYGELLRAAFDLYRPLLYRSLRWPLPRNPDQELQMGHRLSSYLWRGPDGPMPEFADDGHSP